MSLPAHHILPRSAFRHIGVMVIFMYFMAAFSLIGYLSVNDITKSWLTDISDTLNIEIPAFDKEMDYVFDQTQMDQDVIKIQNYLQNDPLVTDIQTSHSAPLTTALEGLDIPAPYFISISLNKNRAPHTEERLSENIRRLVPHVIIHKPEAWEADIRKTALIFQTIFCGLAISILIVTSIILSAVIRTQLKASDDTVKLVHLMGTPVKTIAGLFKTSVTRAVFWGVFLGGGIAAVSLSGLLVILGIGDKLFAFYICLAITALIFIVLCRLITQLTVLSSLRGMP